MVYLIFETFPYNWSVFFWIIVKSIVAPLVTALRTTQLGLKGVTGEVSPNGKQVNSKGLSEPQGGSSGHRSGAISSVVIPGLGRIWRRSWPQGPLLRGVPKRGPRAQTFPRAGGHAKPASPHEGLRLLSTSSLWGEQGSGERSPALRRGSSGISLQLF